MYNDINENINDYVNGQLDAIDKDFSEDEEIRKEAEHISRQLLSNPKVTVMYDNQMATCDEERYEEYELGMRNSASKIILVALSKTKQKAIEDYNKTAFKPKIYTPMMLTAEVDKDFTYDQTVSTLVSAFLCKLRGKFKVEILED